MERLKSLAPGENQEEQQVIFISREQTQLVYTMADALLGMIRILLACFVVLTSVICLMNLYNSIRGYFDERRREFAMLFERGHDEKAASEGALSRGGTSTWTKPGPWSFAGGASDPWSSAGTDPDLWLSAFLIPLGLDAGRRSFYRGSRVCHDFSPPEKGPWRKSP